MSLTSIMNLFQTILTGLANVGSSVIAFMTKEYDILGSTYTVSEIVFGSGVVVCLGFVVVRWIRSLII